MNRRFSPFVLLISILITLSLACNLGTQNVDVMGTHVAETVQAMATPAGAIATQAPAQPSLPPPTNMPPTLTNTPAPPTLTSTPETPTLTFTATVPPLPCDAAQFVSDITIPDGSVITAGGNFTKTWRLMNVGSCAWATNYQIIYDHGDILGGPSAANINVSVAPGGTVDLSLLMKAPTSPGTYKGYWKLRNASGGAFGIGADHNGTFAVSIQVLATPKPPFAVTSVEASAVPPTWVGPCNQPPIIMMIAKITANGAGTVKFHWVADIGTVSGVFPLTFDSKGTKTFSAVPLPPQPVPFKQGWIAVYIDEPNHQQFSKVKYTIQCIP
jgi:hypothetical protein